MASTVSQLTSSGGQQRTPTSQAQRTEEAKKAFTASLISAGANIDAELQTRAKTIHAEAEGLNKQDKRLQKETKQLSKDTDALEKFVKKIEKAMPKTDTFEDEIAKIEADLDMLDEVLRDVEEGDRSDWSEYDEDNGDGKEDVKQHGKKDGKEEGKQHEEDVGEGPSVKPT